MTLRWFIVLFCLSFSQRLVAQTTITDSVYADGMYRNYILYVPASYDGSEAFPLVLNLHGYTSNNLEQFFYANFQAVADTANFIVLLPNGTLDGYGLRFWNCFSADGSGVDDVQFISDLIDTVSAEYAIDPNRIYSTGMSNGGFMSYTLAGELSNRIAAIASVAGSIDKSRFSAMDPQHLTPVMEIHGDADGTVPYNGSADFLSVDSVRNYWIQFNHCNTVPSYVDGLTDINILDGCTATHYVYSGAENGTTVELFKINGGGHTWPGTAFFYLGVTNEDFNACVEIWNFFNRYSLDMLTATEDLLVPDDAILTSYPNPFSGTLNISAISDKNSRLHIYTITGREIFSGEIKPYADLSLDTKSWDAGIYFLELNDGEKTSIQKMVKE